ncbi:MAG: hypothetical protein M1823_005341 [Watsoniomyces obsoletus]|nr:MAG: hypothetical protein M1823_005341 [Watsoniomyces obsoletus]
MPGLTPPELKALEQTRQRLYQLTNSLASLQHHLQTNDPLPPWTSLQSLGSIISQHLLSVSQHLSTHQDLFSSTVVYPLPNFPGPTQESLLGQLLRKKLEPNVETWVEQGRNIARNTTSNGIVTGPEDGQERHGHASSGEGGIEALRELWNWTGAAANEEARKREWGDDFTLEERESGTQNVVTGLKRKLDDDDDDVSDEEEKGEGTVGGIDVMDVDGRVKKTVAAAGKEERLSEEVPIPPLPMNEILRFMSTGVAPRGGEASRTAAGVGLRR